MANQTNNAELLKQYCKGKTAEQVKVIEYFCKDEVNITVQMYPCSEGTDTGSPAL